MRLYWFASVLLVAALLLSACQPIMPPGTETAATTITAGVAHSPRPDAPPYALRGPYAVGVRDFVIEGVDGQRSVSVSVWYPALNSDGRPEAIIYELDFPTNEYPVFTVAGRAIRDAEPDLSGGPYPLLLHNHAAWSLRQEAAYLVEHLASHGFVVIAPAFEDNWGMIFESVPTSEISRSQDAVRTLDLAETLTASGGALAGLVDLEHIAASGWSWGGQVALELAGGRINVKNWLATYCQEYPDVTDCGVYPDHLQEMAELAGLESVPDGLWPDWRDPRVDAVVALAPGVSMFGDGGLDAVEVPVMFMIGSADSSVGPEFAYYQTYENLPSEVKTRVTFANADHILFFNGCATQPAMVEAGYGGVCSDAVWDMDRAHDLVNHFATAFLLAELKGDTEAAAALTPENVAFTGITYETTAYAAVD